MKKYLLIPLVLCGAAALPAQTTLLDDTFTSGTTGPFKTTSSLTIIPGIGSESLPGSAEWFGIGSNTTTTTETYNQGVGIRTPSTAGTSVSQGVIAAFNAPGSYTSLAVGDSLSAALTFNYSAAPKDIASGIRIDLFNSGSTGSTNQQIQTEQGSTGGNFGGLTGLLYSGYSAQFDPTSTGTNTSSTAYYRPTNAATNWLGSNSGSTPLDAGATKNTGAVGTDTFTATLTLDYISATDMQVKLDVFDDTTNTDIAGLGLTDQSTNIISQFDEIGVSFGNVDQTGAFGTLEEVKIVGPTSIPEPSEYAAILGLATLGFVAIRSRRQRRQVAAA
jgi:hypothetical protein